MWVVCYDVWWAPLIQPNDPTWEGREERITMPSLKVMNFENNDQNSIRSRSHFPDNQFPFPESLIVLIEIVSLLTNSIKNRLIDFTRTT